jgi:hypothetical protein
MDCFTHRNGPKVMRLCMKDVSWIDGRKNERVSFSVWCMAFCKSLCVLLG